MFAVFSLLEEVPQIYQIHVHEETCRKNIEELVKQYIIQKRNFDNKDPLTVLLNEIKMDIFSVYPSYSYLKINDDTFEIYNHHLVDKVEKGWVWNGVSKQVQSKKIGYFQIQIVKESNIVEPEIFPEEVTEEQLQMYQDIEKMIDEMLNSIEKGNEELEMEREQIKNLPPIPLMESSSSPETEYILSTPKINYVQSKPLDIPDVIKPDPNLSTLKIFFDIREDPLQEKNIKKNLLKVESKYLSFNEDSEEDTIQSNLEETIDLCDHNEVLSNKSFKCHWSQRGKGKRFSSRKRGGYVPSQAYGFRRIHLY
jgi:hypothetical protein